MKNLSSTLKLKDIYDFWIGIQDSIIYMASQVKPEELTYTFDESLNPMGSEFIHLANAYNAWLEEIVKDGEPHPGRIKADNLTVEKLQGALQQAITRMRKILEKNTIEDRLKRFTGTDEEGPYDFTLEWILWHLIEHDIHHRSHLRLQFKKLNKKIDNKIFYEATSYGRW